MTRVRQQIKDKILLLDKILYNQVEFVIIIALSLCVCMVCAWCVGTAFISFPFRAHTPVFFCALVYFFERSHTLLSACVSECVSVCVSEDFLLCIVCVCVCVDGVCMVGERGFPFALARCVCAI